jgi:hypothetical protein
VLIALFIALFIGLWCPFCRRAIALVSSRAAASGPRIFVPPIHIASVARWRGMTTPTR